jgi:hypothetical protein
MAILKEIKAYSGCKEKPKAGAKKGGVWMSRSVFVFRYRRFITLLIYTVHTTHETCM